MNHQKKISKQAIPSHTERLQEENSKYLIN